MKLSFYRQTALITAILGAGFNLAGCTPIDGKTYSQVSNDYTVTRPLPKDLLVTLREEKVRVIQQGSRLQLILPTYKFFRVAMPELRMDKIQALEVVSLYLRDYVRHHHVRYPIKVSAYVDGVLAHGERYESSAQYAQVIASFMWSHGFQPWQMQVAGRGAENPIVSVYTPRHTAFNNRIVIQVN